MSRHFKPLYAYEVVMFILVVFSLPFLLPTKHRGKKGLYIDKSNKGTVTLHFAVSLGWVPPCRLTVVTVADEAAACADLQ